MIAAFTVVGLRSRTKGSRPHVLLLALIVGAIAYEAAAIGAL